MKTVDVETSGKFADCGKCEEMELDKDGYCIFFAHNRRNNWSVCLRPICEPVKKIKRFQWW